MDSRIAAVLDTFDDMIREERREMLSGGHEGIGDRRLCAIGPDTGQYHNVLPRSRGALMILEIGTSSAIRGSC